MGFAPTDDGHEIYYEVHGTTGPTLVLVSGYMGIANIWQPLLAKLGPKYRFIVHDLRGFGRSSKPESPEAYSVPHHAADLDAIIKALGSQINERLILVTHSMGGNIATAYYHSNPHNVAGIVYTGTYFDGKLIGNFLTYDALTSGIESPSKCVEFYASMGLDETIALEAAKWPPCARRNNARALLSLEIGDMYLTVNVPGLIIQGATDMATPVERCVGAAVDIRQYSLSSHYIDGEHAMLVSGRFPLHWEAVRRHSEVVGTTLTTWSKS